jgi:hypothetical protein
MWLDVSYSNSILLIRHLLHGHFAPWWSPAKVSFRKFFATSNHSVESAPLSLNPPYIAHWSLAIFNTVGLLREGNLVFIVKVVELDGWQNSFNSTKVSSLQHEFTVYVFSSSHTNWNYVYLLNLIGTKKMSQVKIARKHLTSWLHFVVAKAKHRCACQIWVVHATLLA